MKKISVFVLVLIFVLGFSTVSFASYNVNAILNKEYTIVYNGENKSFYNGNGERVYPILFEGTNYLPLRAVSSLFNVAISWDGKNNAVYLGEGEINNSSMPINSNLSKENNEDITALINQEVKVIYNGKIQNFRMNMGDYSKTIYPITFQGTTYLPIRNITELFDCTIEWDGVNKLIKINSLGHIIENKNPVIKENSIYNNGDDFVMYNDEIYFRMYESKDYDTGFIGLLEHNYADISENRIIAKINKYGTDSKLFSNDSIGKFYILDDRFFFRNDSEIYSTDLFGQNRVSFGPGEFRNIDENKHILTIMKNDGLYEIDTLNLKLSKKFELHHEVTLDMIKSKYFSNSNNIYPLHDDGEIMYYYASTDDTFDIYSFDYRTEINKKLGSLSKNINIGWLGAGKATNIDYIAKYGENLYVYSCYLNGNIGELVGAIWAVNDNGNIKEILKLESEFLNYEIENNLMYLHITDTAGSEKWYLLHMDTNILSNFESNVQNYETNKLAKKADDILAKRFTKEFENSIFNEFDVETIKKELNEGKIINKGVVYTGKNFWDEEVLESTYRYDLNNKFVYEYNVAVHGWPTWRGEYYKVGVIYFLVDTDTGIIKEIYRIKF